MVPILKFLNSQDCHICIAVSKNTHVSHIWRHNGHMAIWPYGHYGVKWPYSHMAVMASKMAIMAETAMQKWQSCEDGKSIWPSCLKWKQKLTGGIFPFVFFGTSFVNEKSGGHNSFFIVSTRNFCWWFLTHSGYYLKLGREFLNTFTNYDTP